MKNNITPKQLKTSGWEKGKDKKWYLTLPEKYVISRKLVYDPSENKVFLYNVYLNFLRKVYSINQLNLITTSLI